jgi:hypothetical protein
MLGALWTGAAGLSFVTNRSDAAEDRPGGDDPKNASITHSCCDACGECAVACNKAFHYCLGEASAAKPRLAKMGQTVADCAAFCALSAQMIARQSTMMILSCQACAGACRRCAEECESFANDPELKACFDACQRCEESCRNMIKAMEGDAGAGHKDPTPRR